ncbi:MAG: hypothetical protein KGH55_03175 [Nanoarchaeota archaeon]|nr:hypothetical protein [Nanoarchaeota archaeon]
MKKEQGLGILFLFALFPCALFLSSSFVHADLLSASVTPTTGETGQYKLYDITVTNTNNPPGLNLTQIVIVAPINITISSSGTSANGIYTYSVNSSANTQSLSWNNATGLVKSGASQYFWINASLNQIAYVNLTIASLDTQGNTNQTSLLIFINDTTPPFISFISPTPANGSTLNSSYIPVNVTASDFGSGLKNITIYLYNSTSLVSSRTSSSPQFFYNFTNLTGGKYTLGASTTDLAGNVNQTPSLAIFLNISAIVPCTVSDWSCSWSSCINGTQTQTCIDINGCNTTIWVNGTASCNPSSSCSPNLNCTDWLPVDCQPGENQTKTCTDLNNCTAPTVQTQLCQTQTTSITNSLKFSFPSLNLGKISLPTIIFAAVVAVIIAIIIVTVVLLVRIKNRKSSIEFGQSDKEKHVS